MADRDRRETAIFRTAGYKWVVGAIGFVVGTCLLVGASALLLYVVTEHGERVIGSERLRSLLAITLFVALVAVPTYLLAIASTDSK